MTPKYLFDVTYSDVVVGGVRDMSGGKAEVETESAAKAIIVVRARIAKCRGTELRYVWLRDPVATQRPSKSTSPKKDESPEVYREPVQTNLFDLGLNAPVTLGF